MKKILIVGLALLFAANIFAAGNREQVVIKSAADLDGKRIGVQQGTTGELYVQENVKNAKLSSFKSGIDAALDLKNGAIDAVVLDELPAKEIVFPLDRPTRGRYNVYNLIYRRNFLWKQIAFSILIPVRRRSLWKC